MTDLQNFNLWYKRIIEDLYKDSDAGFPILMITFPLLERYLREKSGSYEKYKVNNKFHDGLLKIFPELNSTDNSKKFWKIYRHGILHQATLSETDKTIQGCLTSKYGCLHVDRVGTIDVIYINPVDFAKKVITAIENDFDTFIAASSANHMLSVIYKLPGGDAGPSGKDAAANGHSGSSDLSGSKGSSGPGFVAGE